ncbi:MAG: hypothetical protein HQK54_17800 [Oligoflexales bacterium]|nr:hypothetical protein [Oligoflexales bacterium]
MQSVVPKTLKLNSTYWVDYGSNNSYSVRLYLSGNIETHLFTLKLTKTGGTMGTSIGAYGYAAGDGKYFLFQVKQGSVGSTTVTDGGYYCFKSNVTLAEVKAMDSSGSATVPAACADLATGLPAASTLYDPNPTTSINVPNAISDFTGKGDYGVGLSY